MACVAYITYKFLMSSLRQSYLLLLETGHVISSAKMTLIYLSITLILLSSGRKLKSICISTRGRYHEVVSLAWQLCEMKQT